MNKSFSSSLNIVNEAQKEKRRESDLIFEHGNYLLSNYSNRLGDEVWNVYEATFIAALDTFENEMAEKCLTALKTRFPKSLRVRRLEGMQLEQQEEYQKAEKVYEEILEENPSNLLALKRQVCISKAIGNLPEAIVRLNKVLERFPMDVASWQALAEIHLEMGRFERAAFCYEELILGNPLNFWFHSRIAEIYMTIGGLDQYLMARKYFAQSLDINANNNVRALLGLKKCTFGIKGFKSFKNDLDNVNERLHIYAAKALERTYMSSASQEMCDIVLPALETISLESK